MRALKDQVRRNAPSLGWTGISQVLWSLSNVVVSLALARRGGPTSLGMFTLAFSVYLLLLGFFRSLVSEPLLTISEGNRAEHAKAALGAGLSIGVGIAAIAVPLGMWIDEAILTMGGLFAPALLVHDAGRYALFQQGRERVAAVVDALWLVASVGLVPFILRSSAAGAFGLWSAGAALGAVWAVRALGRPAGPRVAMTWWHGNARDLGIALAGESIVYSAGQQAATFGLAAIIGTGSLGTLRAAQLLLAPAALALAAFNVFALPRLASGKPDSSGTVAIVSGVATTVALLALAASLSVVQALRGLLLGQEFDVPISLMFPVALVVVLVAAASGFALALKGLRSGQSLMRARLGSVAIGLPAVLILAYEGGLVAAAWGLVAQAGAFLVTSGIAWRRLRAASSTTDPDLSSEARASR